MAILGQKSRIWQWGQKESSCARMDTRARTHTEVFPCAVPALIPPPVRILGEHTLPLAPTLTRARTGAHIGGSQQRSGQRTTERARDQIVNLSFPRLILVQVQQLQQQTGLPANSETPPALQTASDWSSSRLLLWRLRILSLIFSSGYRECTPPLRDKLSLRTLSALFVF